MVAERARQKIIQAREIEEPLEVRKYILPLKTEINIRARNIMDAIDWTEYEKRAKVLPPPLPYNDDAIETLTIEDFP